MSSDAEPSVKSQASEISDDSHEAPPGEAQDYPVLYAALLVALFIVIVFRGVGGHGYVYDDKINVISNSHLYPLTWNNLKFFWSEPYANLFVPVTYSILSVEAEFAAKTDKETGRLALDPAVFHYGNLLLHIINSMLVLLVIRAILGRTLPAMAGAMLFALHPLQAESVNWITETKGLVAAMFALAAIWQYWKFAAGNSHPLSNTPEQVSTPMPNSQRWLHYGLATLAFTLALLSKPSAVAVPLIVLMLDGGLLRRGWVATVMPTVPWLVLAVAAISVARGEQADAQFAYVTPLLYRPIVAGDAITFYLQKLVVPWPLAIDYGRQPELVLGQWSSYVLCLAPLVFAGLLWLLPQGRTLLVFAAVFVLALLPVLGLVPFGFQNISTVADRYAYLALLGPALALAWCIERFNRTGFLVAMAIVLLAFGLISNRQTRHWKNTQTLFEHALRVNNRSVTANLELGNVYANSKREVAEQYYRAALDIDPDDAGANGSLGTILFVRGEIREALKHLRASIASKADNYLAHFYLAQALASLGDDPEAKAHYEQTLEYSPRFDAAKLQLAWLLATSTDDSVRDGRRAIELLDPLVKDNQKAPPLAIDSMAAAHAEVGEFEVATQSIENLFLQVKTLAVKDPNWVPYLRALQQRALLYRDGKPYRGGPTHQMIPSARN